MAAHKFAQVAREEECRAESPGTEPTQREFAAVRVVEVVEAVQADEQEYGGDDQQNPRPRFGIVGIKICWHSRSHGLVRRSPPATKQPNYAVVFVVTAAHWGRLCVEIGSGQRTCTPVLSGCQPGA